MEVVAVRIGCVAQYLHVQGSGFNAQHCHDHPAQKKGRESESMRNSFWKEKAMTAGWIYLRGWQCILRKLRHKAAEATLNCPSVIQLSLEGLKRLRIPVQRQTAAGANGARLDVSAREGRAQALSERCEALDISTGQ